MEVVAKKSPVAHPREGGGRESVGQIRELEILTWNEVRSAAHPRRDGGECHSGRTKFVSGRSYTKSRARNPRAA